MVRLENVKTSGRIEALGALLDRLCSLDLMLPEATLLRAELADLLREPADADADEDEERPAPPVTGARPRPVAPALRMPKGRTGSRSPLVVLCPC